jgi:tetratricopeptide (TPR) repeat protein
LHKIIKVQKKQIILLAAAALLLGLLLFFGKTVSPNKAAIEPIVANNTVEILNFTEVLKNSKQNLSVLQNKQLSNLEQNLQKATSENDKKKVFKQLSTFWKDSARIYEPYLFYLAEEAKLENSEKSLTFAAQQFTNNLLDVVEPSIQNWLGTNAKVLFEKALAINPNNDSSKIGLGACYILGNVSSNPMEGILPVREIATKNPNNLYAQMVLGLGGKKSGQFDKAIERFLIINSQQPNNLVVILHLAECFEQKNDKINAKVWYLKASGLVKNVTIKKEIEKRITVLN